MPAFPLPVACMDSRLPPLRGGEDQLSAAQDGPLCAEPRASEGPMLRLQPLLPPLDGTWERSAPFQSRCPSAWAGACAQHLHPRELLTWALLREAKLGLREAKLFFGVKVALRPGWKRVEKLAVLGTFWGVLLLEPAPFPRSEARLPPEGHALLAPSSPPAGCQTSLISAAIAWLGQHLQGNSRNPEKPAFWFSGFIFNTITVR